MTLDTTCDIDVTMGRGCPNEFAEDDYVRPTGMMV